MALKRSGSTARPAPAAKPTTPASATQKPTVTSPPAKPEAAKPAEKPEESLATKLEEQVTTPEAAPRVQPNPAPPPAPESKQTTEQTTVLQEPTLKEQGAALQAQLDDQAELLKAEGEKAPVMRMVEVHNLRTVSFRQPSTGIWIYEENVMMLDDGWLRNQCRAKLLKIVKE